MADSSDTATLLSRVDLFTGLSGRQLKRLADRSKEVRHDPAEPQAAAETSQRNRRAEHDQSALDAGGRRFVG